MKDGEYDCSFSFSDETERKKYKYIVITGGDLDLNNAIMLKGKRDLNNYLKELKKLNFSKEIYAIVKVGEWVKK